MLLKALVRAIYQHRTEPSNLIYVNILDGVKRDVLKDVAEAFDIGRSLICMYPDEWKNSNSFVDFLFKLCGATLHHEPPESSRSDKCCDWKNKYELLRGKNETNMKEIGKQLKDCEMLRDYYETELRESMQELDGYIKRLKDCEKEKNVCKRDLNELKKQLDEREEIFNRCDKELEREQNKLQMTTKTLNETKYKLKSIERESKQTLNRLNEMERVANRAKSELNHVRETQKQLQEQNDENQLKLSKIPSNELQISRNELRLEQQQQLERIHIMLNEFMSHLEHTFQFSNYQREKMYNVVGHLHRNVPVSSIESENQSKCEQKMESTESPSEQSSGRWVHTSRLPLPQKTKYWPNQSYKYELSWIPTATQGTVPPHSQSPLLQQTAPPESFQPSDVGDRIIQFLQENVNRILTGEKLQQIIDITRIREHFNDFNTNLNQLSDDSKNMIRQRMDSFRQELENTLKYVINSLTLCVNDADKIHLLQRIDQLEEQILKKNTNLARQLGECNQWMANVQEYFMSLFPELKYDSEWKNNILSFLKDKHEKFDTMFEKIQKQLLNLQETYNIKLTFDTFGDELKNFIQNLKDSNSYEMKQSDEPMQIEEREKKPHHKDSMDNLRDKLVTSEYKLYECNVNYEILKEQKVRLEVKLKECENSLEKSKLEKLNLNDCKPKEEYFDYREKFTASEYQLNLCQSENEELKMKLKEYESNLDKSQSEKFMQNYNKPKEEFFIKNDIDNLREKLTASEHRLHIYMSENVKLNKQKELLETKFQECNESLQHHIATLERLEKNYNICLKELTKEMEKKPLKVNVDCDLKENFTEQYKKVLTQKLVLEIELERVFKELKHITDEMNYWKNQHDILVDTNKKLADYKKNSHIIPLQNKLKQSEDKIEKYTIELGDCEIKLAQSNERIKDLQNQITNMENGRGKDDSETTAISNIILQSLFCQIYKTYFIQRFDFMINKKVDIYKLQETIKNKAKIINELSSDVNDIIKLLFKYIELDVGSIEGHLEEYMKDINDMPYGPIRGYFEYNLIQTQTVLESLVTEYRKNPPQIEV